MRWISVVPRFALHELTLYNDKGDWIKGKNPAGNLVGCHPAFGGRIVKGFTLTGVIGLWGSSRSLHISKLFWCYTPRSALVPARQLPALTRWFLIDFPRSESTARLPASVFPTRITTSTHLRATDLKFSSPCFYQIYSLGEGVGLLSVPL